MKLHLEPQYTISNFPPKVGPIRHENMFIYYSNTNVTVSDLSLNKIIHKFKYEDVQALEVHQSCLYICTSDIYILDLASFQIVSIVKLSKALISKIALFESDILVFKVNKKLCLLHHDNNQSCEKKFEVQLDSFCDGLFLSEQFFGYFGSEGVAVFSSNCKIAEYESECVLGVYPHEKSVYVLQSNGDLLEIVSGYNVGLGLEVQSCCFASDHILCISNSRFLKVSYIGEILEEFDVGDKIEEYSGTVIDYYSHARNSNLLSVPDFQRNKKLKTCESNSREENASEHFISEVSDNSQDAGPGGRGIGGSRDLCSQSDYACNTDEEDNSVQDLDSITSDGNQGLDPSVSGDIEEASTGRLCFTLVDPGLIKTSENDYIFFKDECITKLLAFADDITDSVCFEDHLVLGTSSGYLKFTDINGYSGGECILDSHFLKIHSDSITACRLYKDILVTASKDRTVGVFRILRHAGLRLVKLFEFSNFPEEITALAYENNLLVVATSDFLVHIFKSDQCLPEKEAGCFDVKGLDFLLDYSQFFNTFENVSVQKLHSRMINHISLTSEFIITSSSDKSAKILSLDGGLVKTIQSDKVLHTSFSNKYVAVCSHRAVKIIAYPTLSPVCSFQARRPVLASCFYNGYLLTLSDVLRVFDIDKKKCVKVYDLGLTNPWSFNFPFICAENSIIVLKDISEEKAKLDAEAVRLLAEHTILFDRFIHEKQFDRALDVVLKRSDEKKAYQTISQGYYHFGNLDFLRDYMKNGDAKNKILDILMKNASLKNSLVFNEILNSYLISKIDRVKKEKIREVVCKHVDAIDNIYIELLGLEAHANGEE